MGDVDLDVDFVEYVGGDSRVAELRARAAELRRAASARMNLIVAMSIARPGADAAAALERLAAALRACLDAESAWMRDELAPRLDAVQAASAASERAARAEAEEVRTKPMLHRRRALYRELREMDLAETRAAAIEAALCAERGTVAAWSSLLATVEEIEIQA